MAKNAEARKRSRDKNEALFLVQIALSNRGTATERGAVQKMRRMAKDPEVEALLRRRLSDSAANHKPSFSEGRGEEAKGGSRAKEIERRLAAEVARRLHVNITFVEIDMEMFPED